MLDFYHPSESFKVILLSRLLLPRKMWHDSLNPLAKVTSKESVYDGLGSEDMHGRRGRQRGGLLVKDLRTRTLSYTEAAILNRESGDSELFDSNRAIPRSRQSSLKH